MRGIVLAAGQGARLRPLTNHKPKCLVEFRGKPIIEYAIKAMRSCDISEIIVVTGYLAEAVQLKGVQCVNNHNYSSTNMVESLFCAEPFLSGDILISYGDIVYSAETLAALVNSPHDFAITVDLDWKRLWDKRMEDPLKDAETLKLGENSTVLELGRKPLSFDDIEAQYMGLIKISSSAIEEVKSYYHSLERSKTYGGRPFLQMYMTEFIQSVIDFLMPVHAVKVRGGWTEIDSPEDLNVDIDIPGI